MSDPEELIKIRDGVLHFDELQNIIIDWLSDHVPDARGSYVSFRWVLHEETKTISLEYEVSREAKEVESLQHDNALHQLAHGVFNQHADLVTLVKNHNNGVSRHPGCLNALVGEVFKELVKTRGLEGSTPEKAFELVVNLLGLSFKDQINGQGNS